MSYQEQRISQIDFERKYKAMSSQQQISFICRLAHQITVCARSTYVPGSEEITDPQMLRWLNEAQHFLIGQACNLIENNQHRYSDDSFCEALFARNSHALYGSTFSQAISQTLEIQNETNNL